MGDNADLSAAESKAVAGIKGLMRHAVLTETHPDLEHNNPQVFAVHRLYVPPYGMGYQHSVATGRPIVAADGTVKALRGVPSKTDPIHGDDKPFDPAPWLDYPRILLWGADHFRARLPDGGKFLCWDKSVGQGPADSFADAEFAWTNLPTIRRAVAERQARCRSVGFAADGKKGRLECDNEKAAEYLDGLGKTDEILKAMKSDAYEIAKAGGKHSGMLRNYAERPKAMIERGWESIKKQIELHELWISDPCIKLPSTIDGRELHHLVSVKWPRDIARLKEEADVLRGLMEDGKNGQ